MTDRSPAPRYVGQPLPRFEDLRLVRGRGRYTDDFALPDQVFAVFVRSPYAHARIRAIDTSAAKRSAGVLAVLTGADYLADGCQGIRHGPVPRDTLRHDLPAFTSTASRPILDEPHFPLAIERVRHVGEAVAVIVAETIFAARDAAELVTVEYEPQPAVTDVREAIAPGAPLLWNAAAGNVAVEGEFGDRAATERAFAAAEIVIEHEFRNQRIVNAQIEPRAAIGSYDAKADSYLMIAGSQGAVRQREYLAAALDAPIERVHVVCPDVGGGFGPRSNIYAEQVVVTWAARRLGRPVRWTSDRSEAFLTDYQGRDSLATARMALDKSGRIRALEADILFNVGGLPVSYVPLSNAPRVIAGVYDIAAAHVRVRGVMTNSAPTAPYRGAGRPEATFIIERLLDIAAERLGIDRIELRRRNLVARAQFPYRAATGITIDSGDFLANMTQALALADWAGFAKRRERAAARGRLAGIGLANYIESPVGAPHERVQATVLSEGVVEVVVGTQSTGQGHETSFAQVMADELGVAPDLVRFVTGDTRLVAVGGGSHSDRSMRFAGALMLEAAREIRDRARQAAATLLEADAASLVFQNGLYQVPGSNRSLSLFDIARAIDAQGAEKLGGEASFTGRMPTHPTGAAICELEVDPETGAVEIVRYTSVDDVGQPINPLILHGQVHGGIAQGIGQALFEGAVLEPRTGQVLTGSFMDYALPRADTLPQLEVALAEDPTARHPLRVKGGGESGITPSLACVMNALFDALSPLGVTDLQMPATPARVWEAIRRMRVYPFRPIKK